MLVLPDNKNKVVRYHGKELEEGIRMEVVTTAKRLPQPNGEVIITMRLSDVRYYDQDNNLRRLITDPDNRTTIKHDIRYDRDDRAVSDETYSKQDTFDPLRTGEWQVVGVN